MDKRPGSPLTASTGKKQCEAISAAAPAKVAIIFHRFEPKNHFEFTIYVVDVDSVSGTVGGGKIKDFHQHDHPAAAVRVPIPEEPFIIPAVCLLKSTLYIFEGVGVHDAENACWEGDTPPEVPKSAYKALALDDDMTRVLDATTISPMNHAKGFPVAIPTPKGDKILVFSTKFVSSVSGRSFELFDPIDESFTTFPPLPRTGPSCGYYDVRRVQAYSFIDESRILLVISMDAFVLDINTTRWDEIDISYIMYRGYFETFMGRYTVAPQVVGNPTDGYEAISLMDDLQRVDSNPSEYNDFQGATRYSSPLSKFPPSDAAVSFHSEFTAAILPLHHTEKEKNVYNTCFVQVDMQRWEDDEGNWSNKGRILIDVCRTDVTARQTTITKCVSVSTSPSGTAGVSIFTV